MSAVRVLLQLLIGLVAYCEAGQSWGDYSDDGCVGCGQHQYSARLYGLASIGGDWVGNCKKASLPSPGHGIPDNTIPNRPCDDQGTFGGIRGIWQYPDSTCQHWGDFGSRSCQGTGIQQYASVLYGIPDGVDWKSCCQQTAAVVNGFPFKAPTTCEQANFLGIGLNIWGEFNVPVIGCGNAGPFSVPSKGDCDGSKHGYRDYSAKFLGTGDCASASATINGLTVTPSTCGTGPSPQDATFQVEDPDCFPATDGPFCPDSAGWDFASQQCLSCNEPPISSRRLLDHPSKPGWVSSNARVCWNAAVAAYILVTSAARYLSSPSTATPPTVYQLIQRTDVQAAFRQAYADSTLADGRTQEQGGWIYANRFDANDIVIIRADSSHLTDSVDGDSMTGHLIIHLGSNPQLPNNFDYRMVADFHTHPAYTPANGNTVTDPEVSTVDIGNQWASLTPGFVIAGHHTWSTGPESRAHMDGPRAYAVTVDALSPGNVPFLPWQRFRSHPDWSVNGNN